MKLSGQTINHLNAITHDGKVVGIGTDVAGGLWYTVKRSGFEDTALQEGADPFGFEGWKALRLGESVADASVIAEEQRSLTDSSGNVLVKRVYGDAPEVTKSADASVQLVSALNHLFVLRQSPSGKILVNRFVLDGMTNELVPKLEVRFRRSRQRLEPHESASSKDGGSADNLDYRDIDGKNFYEAAIELGFAGTVTKGWFSPVFVPTAEGDRNRWHLFVVDAASGKLTLYTVGSDSDGLFDVKDYLHGESDPEDPERTLYRAIPGIIRRTIDLTGLTLAGGPAATTYDLQKEQITDAGPQLIRDAIRVMLAVPVKAAGSDVVRTAALSFALAADGTLSQIDPTPDQSSVLRSDYREVITPLTLLDDIQEIGSASPPPAGTIVATEQGEHDKLQVRSKQPLPATLAAGANVKLRATQSYDGLYKVLSVAGDTFQVAATFTDDEAGFWEVVPDKLTGLVFDNRVAGAEKTPDGKLMIRSPGHELKVGDEVQISGTRDCDGTFAVASIVDGQSAFVLDAPYFAGEAANLSRVVRRGLQMDGNDRVEVPDLELAPPTPERSLGRTLSAWVRVDAAGNVEQRLIADSGGMMALALGSDSKVKLVVRMSDGATRTVTDPTPITVGTWVHFAGSLGYATAGGGETQLALCRNGVEVSRLTVGHGMPSHMGDQVITFDGVEDYVEVPAFASPTAAITVSVWARSATATWNVDGCLVSKRDAFVMHPIAGTRKILFYVWLVGVGWSPVDVTPSDIQSWHQYTGTFDGKKLRFYVDGLLLKEVALTGAIQADPGVLCIGFDDGVAGRYFKGQLAGVEVWSRARSPTEIAEGASKRLSGREVGLVGYWPLDDGATRDLSPAKRHAALKGSPWWRKVAYLHPQMLPPASQGAKLAKVMKFDGVGDYLEVANGAQLFTGSFTVAAWMKVTGGSGTFRAPVTCRGMGLTGFVLYVTPNNVLSVAMGNGAAWCGLNGPPVAEGTWIHVAVTLSGTTMTLYVNGTFQATSSCAYVPPNRPMRIGAGTTEGDPSYYWNGYLADVQIWSRARLQTEILEDMNRRPSGRESGLAGYWPLETGAEDRTPNRRSGSLKGSPELVSVGSAYTLGQGFSGELADAQIWDEARPAKDIKATMHLLLTGKERGLAAYYRMGAIVSEESPPIVPDFSHHGRSGVVIGDPYAGARRLKRATSTGAKVVKYASDELVAVSQRGVYEETFEFRVTAPQAFDPMNADGTGLKLFAFSYWGKSSRGSREVITFPAGSAVESDFQSLGGGWYKAAARVVVPDGVSLMRAFGIVDVRGRWGAEATAPATEWTAIDIRKHRIRLISDVVTCDSYTDVTALSSLPAQAQAVQENVRLLRGAEARVARAELQIADLLARVDVAQNNQRYVAEKSALTATLSSLSAQKTAAQSERAAILNDRFSYWCKLRVKHSQMIAQAGAFTIYQWTVSDNEFSQPYERFRFVSLGNGWFKIHALYLDPPVAPHSFMTACDGGEISAGAPDVVAQRMQVMSQPGQQWRQQWRFEELGDGYGYIKNASGTVWDVRGAFTALYTDITHQAPNGGNHQRWAIDKTTELHADAIGAVAAKDSLIASLSSQLTAGQHRLDWLNQVLAANESISSLQSQLASAQGEFAAARTDVAARNTAFLSQLTQAPPASMPLIAADDRELETTGAVLDFAQPSGGVRLSETCDGNVLLTYIDTQGRLRATAYDAAADSRNTAFEQWIPDAVRAAADIRDSGDKVTLAKAVTLPANGWTCEAWAHYPLATKADGTAYGTSVVAAADGKPDAPLVVRKGTRLGLLTDGWFFDSGADLARTLAPGWHHLAAATARGKATFYSDGLKLGTVKTTQPALRFSGSADRVEVPAHANPSPAVTVSIWARSATPTWNGNAHLVSKRDAFLVHPVAGGRAVRLFVFIAGANWAYAEYTPADIQGWHLYTGTYDGNYIRLYIDGEVVAETAAAGAVQIAPGPLHIGHDPSNNAYLNGDIAEVAVWSFARSLGDVRDDLFRTLTGNEPGLTGYWRMEKVEEGGAVKVRDLTSNARHGLVKGAPVDATITSQRAMDIKVLGNVAAGGSPIGRLAELRLWGLALTDVEVATHARTSTSGSEPGLLAYWPLDEGAGSMAFDRSAGGQAHGALVGVDWVGRTANTGNPGSRVLALPDRGSATVTCPPVALAGKSFSIECWARRSGAGAGTSQMVAVMGSAVNNAGLHFGFRDTSRFTLAFYYNDVDTPLAVSDTDWHHFAGTYDAATMKQRLYVDGVMVAERTSTSHYTGSGNLILGMGLGGSYFSGELAELRIWDRARTGAELQANLRRRLTGAEANLLAYYPLDEVSGDNKIRDRRSGSWSGQLNGPARLLLSTALPLAGADTAVTAEYSSVEVSGEGKQQALMRRFYGFAAGGDAELLPEQRVEELTLQWVGNTQINPTLLGYIEGAPPVPSENLLGPTDEYEYGGATSVTLAQSDETTYAWQRSESRSAAFSVEGFAGASWSVSSGLVVETTVSEGDVGAVFDYETERSTGEDTSVSATSSLATTDSLALTGMFEDAASSPALGPRWIPKNVGYAVVISGMADVFVTKLKRSGRMVSYDIRPVEGVPLDVNTITFMVNPAYTLNGSLDGLVGSMPADPTFYPHVPEMRAQYGSLYPASYFRLKEAYALKDAIERADKERESFFYNFDANQLDEQGSFARAGAASVSAVSGQAGPSEAELGALSEQSEQQKREARDEAAKRQAEIRAKLSSLEGRVRAGAAFADWQLRMENIQRKAGKRNIVNTYVWDGDGGMRAEEQSFASTIEHSINTELSHGGGGGASTETAVFSFKFSLSLVGYRGKVEGSSKTLSLAKSLELTVDLSGVDKRGITDLRGAPLFPGEKVDRYRFMSFYLEGSTEHFNDFFSYVVDPEWLMSGDEEARALRQARSAKPNKCWRVLHRVTYVERPALVDLRR
ncbi:LamG-like jellyroll fold domain-containing protein [Archangium sp.]|uniref:LamG-like jellyroll fold domain-containing protein n=1 Tax=Archangium sp. TaxID=1872627 RepID=UPI00286BE9A5|nr:LamG-like jellyroll fold domain-containing protein [Archangium sp.]